MRIAVITTPQPTADPTITVIGPVGVVVVVDVVGLVGVVCEVGVVDIVVVVGVVGKVPVNNNNNKINGSTCTLTYSSLLPPPLISEGL